MKWEIKRKKPGRRRRLLGSVPRRKAPGLSPAPVACPSSFVVVVLWWPRSCFALLVAPSWGTGVGLEVSWLDVCNYKVFMIYNIVNQ